MKKLKKIKKQMKTIFLQLMKLESSSSKFRNGFSEFLKSKLDTTNNNSINSKD